MAISFNDNIRVQANKPLELRFGPFASIAEANSVIPISQRVHGLIFGVYTVPGDIANSDIEFYYYWDDLSDTSYKRLLLEEDVLNAIINSTNASAANPFVTLEQLSQVIGSQNYVIQGGSPQWSGTGFVFNAPYTVFVIGGVVYTDGPETITLTNADPTNPRRDRFVLSASGWGFITGTPGAIPIAEEVNSITEIDRGDVRIETGATTPTITNESVYLENTEWVTSSGGLGTFNPNSITNPFAGTKVFEATDVQSGGNMLFTRSADFNVSNIDSIGLQLKLKSTMNNGRSLRAQFLDNLDVPVSQSIPLSFVKSDIAGYQFCSLDKTDLGFVAATVRKLRITYSGTGGPSTYAGYFIDNVIIQSGVVQPPSSLNITLTEEVSGTGTSGTPIVVSITEKALSNRTETTTFSDNDILLVRKDSDGQLYKIKKSSLGLEPAITAGTTAQYWRGDKTFQTLNTAAVPESTNLYFTEARVQLTPLTGYTVGTNTPVTAAHTLLGAIQDFQGQINARVSGGGTVNYVQKITSTGVIGDSQIVDNGVNIIISGTTNDGSTLTSISQSGTGRALQIVRSVNGATRAMVGLIQNHAAGGIEAVLDIQQAALASPAIKVTNDGDISVFSVTGSGNLDTSGTARIRTIANLGTPATNVMVPSATGVQNLRTVTEFRGDIGAQATIAGTLTNGYVATIVAGVPTWAAATGGGGGGGISGLTTNYIPKATSATTIGDSIISDLTSGSNNGYVLFGASTPLGVSFPLTLSLGGTYATGTPGSAANLKLRIYSTSLLYSQDDYGFGVSDALFEMRSGNLTDIGFFPGGVDSMRILRTGITRIQRLEVDSTYSLVNKLTVFGCSTFGDTSITGSTTPSVVSFGASFGTNVAGDAGNLKWKLFTTTGITANASDYGIGMSSNLMELRAGSGAAIGFFPNNGVESFRILSTGNLKFIDAKNFEFGATTGTKIGTATTQKIAFWNKTPIIQPTTGITGAALVSNVGTTITSTDTFGGYTLQQIAAILINTGLAA